MPTKNGNDEPEAVKRYKTTVNGIETTIKLTEREAKERQDAGEELEATDDGNSQSVGSEGYQERQAAEEKSRAAQNKSRSAESKGGASE